MTELDIEPIKERLAAATEPLPEEARMGAYYYGFERTDCGPVDAVLSAVAIAGKGSHNTDGWTNRDVYGYYDKRPGLPANPRIDDWTGGSAVELIQLTSKASAEKVKSLSDDLAALVAEVERLRATVIVEQNRRQPWVKLAHQNSQEVKRLRESVRKFSDDLLFGDGITEPAATLNDMVDPIRDAFEAQHDHIECPIICELCGEKLADKTCEHCHGSGADNQAASAAGAWVECEWCGGAGKIHEGCVEKSYADIATENSVLRAQIDAVRAATANHPNPCSKHPEDDPVSCGWKSAYIDVVETLAC